MQSKSTKILWILTGVYAAMYFTGIGIALHEGELSFKNLNDILFLLLSVIFLSAIALLWANKKTAGIIFGLNPDRLRMKLFSIAIISYEHDKQKNCHDQ